MRTTPRTQRSVRMATRMATVLAASLAAGSLAPGSAAAQTPPSTVPSAVPSPAPAPMAPVVDRASALLSQGHAAEAAALLSADLLVRGVDPASNDPAAVLLRLANGMAHNVPPPPPPDAPPGTGLATTGAYPTGAVPTGAYPTGAVPTGAYPTGLATTGAYPTGAVPTGAVPTGAYPTGAYPTGATPLVARPLSRNRHGARGGGETFGLYATGVTYGLGTGIWIDVMANTSDVRVALWIPILGGALGALGAYLMDNPTSIRRGRPNAMNAGMILGASAGLALGLQHDAHNSTVSCPPGPGMCTVSGTVWGTRGVATATWAGATLGILGGYGLAALTDASPGSGTFVVVGGMWMGTLGLLTGAATQTSSDLGLYWLVGEGLGVAATLASASTLRPTSGQSGWMSLGVLGGALLGGGLAALTYGTTDHGPVGPILLIEAGMIGGGIAGFLLGKPNPARTEPTEISWLDRHPLSPGVLPVQGGALFTLSVGNAL